MSTERIGKKIRTLTAVGLASTLLGAPAFAQRGGGGGQGGGQGGPGAGPGGGPGGPTITDPKEADAYKAYVAAKGDDRIKKGTDFITNYPKSVAAATVGEQVVSLEYQKQDWPAFYSASDKYLAIAPDDSGILAVTAWVIARNFKDGQTSPTLDQAEKDAKHALDTLATKQKPPNMPDDQFTKGKATIASQAHSALGLVYGRQQKPTEAAAELEQVANPDGTDVYILGASYEMLGKHVEATQEFKKCATMPGVLQQPCGQNADQTSKEGPDGPPPSN
jgi:hypothetical protein